LNGELILKDSLNYEKFIILLYVIHIFVSIFIIIINLEFFSVIHYNLSEWIPTVVYVTYKSREVFSIYLLLVLNAFGLITYYGIKNKKIRKIAISILPILSSISIILILINPHILLINAKGAPPTIINYLNVSGCIFLVQYFIFISFSIYFIFQEGFLKEFLIYTTISILALLTANLIHESGHAFFVLISGGKIEKFVPFPWLGCSAGCVEYSDVPTYFNPVVLMGGEIFQWITLILGLVILYKKKLNPRVSIFLKIILIAAWLDFPLYTINNTLGIPHWFIIGANDGDIVNFVSLTGFPLELMILFSIVQITLGLFFIFRKQIFSFYKRSVIYNEKIEQNL